MGARSTYACYDSEALLALCVPSLVRLKVVVLFWHILVTQVRAQFDQ